MNLLQGVWWADALQGPHFLGPGFCLVLTPRSSLSQLLSANDQKLHGGLQKWDTSASNRSPLMGNLGSGAPPAWARLAQSCAAVCRGFLPTLLAPSLSICECLTLIAAGRLSPLAPAPPLLYRPWSFPLIHLSQFGFSFADWFLEDSQSNTRCSQESEVKKPQTNGRLEAMHTTHTVMTATWVQFLPNPCSAIPHWWLETGRGGNVYTTEIRKCCRSKLTFFLLEPLLLNVSWHTTVPSVPAARILRHSGPQITFPFFEAVAMHTAKTCPLVIYLPLTSLLM